MADVLRRIGDATRAVANSKAESTDAVTGARRHEETWTQIATMLDTSRQAAHKQP